MPVKRNITSIFLNPHRANLQACSPDESNFVFSHLRRGSTSNYNPKAIRCLMSMYHAKRLIEADKHYKATAVMSCLKEIANLKSDEGSLSGSRSQEKQKYLGLTENIVSLGGKSAPNLYSPKSMFQTEEIISPISHRAVIF
jgi:hypothetical protein